MVNIEKIVIRYMLQDNPPVDSIWLLGIDDIVYNHSSEPHFSILDFPLHLIFNRDEMALSIKSSSKQKK